MSATSRGAKGIAARPGNANMDSEEARLLHLQIWHENKEEYHRQVALAIKSGIYSVFASKGFDYLRVDYVARRIGLNHNSTGNRLRALEHAGVLEHKRRPFSGGWVHEYKWIGER